MWFVLFFGVTVLFAWFYPPIAAFIFVGMEKYSSGRCPLQKTALHSKHALGTELSNKDFMKKLGTNRMGDSQDASSLKPTCVSY